MPGNKLAKSSFLRKVSRGSSNQEKYKSLLGVFFSLRGKAWWEVFSLLVDGTELCDKRCSFFFPLQRALIFGFQSSEA